MINRLISRFSTRKFAVGVPIRASSRGFIHSLEGGIYLLEVDTGGERAYVKAKFSEKAYAFGAFHDAKRCARCLGLREVVLALDTPYDQMIGIRAA